jgi:hypothetical protein
MIVTTVTTGITATEDTNKIDYIIKPSRLPGRLFAYCTLRKFFVTYRQSSNLLP